MRLLRRQGSETRRNGRRRLCGVGFFADRLFAVLRRHRAWPVRAFGVNQGAPCSRRRCPRVFADLFLEYSTSNGVEMEDDIIKESDENIRLGIGIRVLKGPQTGFGFTSQLELDAMRRAALTAAAIASSGAAGAIAPLAERPPGRQVYQLRTPFSEGTLADRIALVKEGYAAAAAHDKRIVKVRSEISDELQVVTILNSEGLLTTDVRPQAGCR
jgi:TldD protein